MSCLTVCHLVDFCAFTLPIMVLVFFPFSWHNAVVRRYRFNLYHLWGRFSYAIIKINKLRQNANEKIISFEKLNHFSCLPSVHALPGLLHSPVIHSFQIIFICVWLFHFTSAIYIRSCGHNSYDK